jgi:hypothetical protein
MNPPTGCDRLERLLLLLIIGIMILMGTTDIFSDYYDGLGFNLLLILLTLYLLFAIIRMCKTYKKLMEKKKTLLEKIFFVLMILIGMVYLVVGIFMMIMILGVSLWGPI